MMFDQDPNEQANISGADLAILIDELAEAKKLIEQLLSVAPMEVECRNMHHAKKDQHSYDETCPVVIRYAEALAAAKAFRERNV